MSQSEKNTPFSGKGNGKGSGGAGASGSWASAPAPTVTKAAYIAKKAYLSAITKLAAAKNKDTYNGRHSARSDRSDWGIGGGVRDPFFLGAASKKRDENNAMTATLAGTGAGLASGAIIGGTLRGATGHPAHSTARLLATEKPLGILKHQRDMGFGKAQSTFSKSLSSGKGIVPSTVAGAKQVAWAPLSKHVGKGALIGATLGFSTQALTNRAAYGMGSLAASRDEKKHAKRST